MMTRTRLFLSLSFILAAMPAAYAQDAATAAEPETHAPGNAPKAAPAEEKSLHTVTVVGSRRVGASSDTQTLAPVDVLPMEQAAKQGAQFDMAQTLQYTVPSFNSTRQTGADGADLIDGAALRGLGSDQTLVLVNGKRHHTVALVNLFGARNRGNTGTDLNVFPLLGIERVEVLRDGAAAQYGSDAITGVMNIVLKRDTGCETVRGYGQYARGDGENRLSSAYCGMALGERGGFVSATAEIQGRNRSDRSEPGNPRIIGDSKVHNDTLYLNGEWPLTEAAQFYFTLGAQNRVASSAAFARGGLGSDDIPSRNAAAMYPEGFVPFINGDVDDRYAIAGSRFDWGDWRMDLSTTWGHNRMKYDISRTLNASIANEDLLDGGEGVSADRFNAGGFAFRQNTTNLDFTRYYDAVRNGLNVAFGLEHRWENYRIYAGEPGSYIDADGPGGGNAGSQGFPGFQPADVADSDRRANAAYLDLELDATDRLRIGLAGRYEDYSDFGDTLNGKLALGWRATESLLLRGSLSSGFRAPSLQQRYFSSTFTDFISGEPVDVVLAPNGGTIARAAGIPDLTEETSDNYSVGLTWNASDDLSVTADAYRIDIADRIVLTGRFDNTDPDIGAILDGLGVGQAQFFINSVDTRTQGLDLTVSHRRELGPGQLNTFLGFNHSKTSVQEIRVPDNLVGREDVVLSERERLFIEQGAPRNKAILGFDYAWSDWNANLRIIHFGSQTLGTFSGPPVPNQRYAAKTSADLSVTYHFNEDMQLTVGGANIFDVHPSAQDPNETDNGFRYESVQFGLNGAAYFVRFAANFF